MNKILITGGAGFIGSHLAEELLENGYEVAIIDNFLNGNKIPENIRPSIKIIEGDVRDNDLIKKKSKGCSYIFHFAAFLGVDLVANNHIDTMLVESIGTQNAVNASIENNIEKLIYASTSGVYGKTAIEKSVREDFLVDPRTSYSIAKRFNEIYLNANYLEKKLNSISIRFFNVFGERQDNRMVIPRFIKQASLNEPLTIYGTGKQTRDFTYIKDVVSCIRLLSEKVVGCEIFNLCGNNEISIYELAVLIKKMTNSNSQIKIIPMPGTRYDFEVERRSGDSDKLKKAIDKKPNTNIIDGLKACIEEHLQNRNIQ